MKKRVGSETRDILKIDNPNIKQIKAASDHYFENRGGLILPKEYGSCCGGCGRELYKLKKENYFGQEFCSDCVEKWKNGY